MKVKIYTHKAEKLVFYGELNVIPRQGEFIEFNQELGCFEVEKVFHYIESNRVSIELKFDGQENLKDVRKN